MSMQDILADMLTRIRNAQLAEHASVTLPSSKLKLAVASVLKKEGYVLDITVDESNKPQMTIKLKYYNGLPVIESIKRVSRPGLRIYSKSKDIREVKNNLGIAIVSTSKGVMTDKEAKASNVGGEILCEVF